MKRGFTKAEELFSLYLEFLEDTQKDCPAILQA